MKELLHRIVRQRYEWPEDIKSASEKFKKEQFERGKLHGQCPERFDNENIGHAVPCPFYHVGFIFGTHERLLIERKIPREEWDKWILDAELKNARFPLSSPATYSLVHKNSLEESDVFL